MKVLSNFCLFDLLSLRSQNDIKKANPHTKDFSNKDSAKLT